MIPESMLPLDYKAYIRLRGGDIPPWGVLDGEWVERFDKTIREQYPWLESLHPFAQHDDDVAAFVVRGGKTKVIFVHLGEVRGYEVSEGPESFCDWLRIAVDDAVETLSARSRGGDSVTPQKS